MLEEKVNEIVYKANEIAEKSTFLISEVEFDSVDEVKESIETLSPLLRSEKKFKELMKMVKQCKGIKKVDRILYELDCREENISGIVLMNPETYFSAPVSIISRNPKALSLLKFLVGWATIYANLYKMKTKKLAPYYLRLIEERESEYNSLYIVPLTENIPKGFKPKNVLYLPLMYRIYYSDGKKKYYLVNNLGINPISKKHMLELLRVELINIKIIASKKHMRRVYELLYGDESEVQQ